jgi:hypothetical protein
MTIVMFCFSLFAFRLSLYVQQSRRSQKLSLLPSLDIPGKFVGLVKKDFRYSFRLLDVYLALPVLVFANIYLVSNATASSIAFWIVVNLLLLPCLSLAFNSFGLENSFGLDRYALLPLSGRDTLFSKNLSFALVVFLLFTMKLPVAIWRVGATSSAIGLMILILVTLAYLSYGNWLTVYQPFKMQFYRFASGGSPVDALLGIVLGSFPGCSNLFFEGCKRVRSAQGGIVARVDYYHLSFLPEVVRSRPRTLLGLNSPFTKLNSVSSAEPAQNTKGRSTKRKVQSSKYSPL